LQLKTENTGDEQIKGSWYKNFSPIVATKYNVINLQYLLAGLGFSSIA
jgi:hypothetical protein